MFTTNPDKAKAKEKLVHWIGTNRSRGRVSWLEIETETGIPMSGKDKARGRAWMRQSILACGLEWVTIHGEGIELSSADNAADVVAEKRVRVFRGVRRMDRCVTRLEAAHISQMSAQQRDRFQAEASILATLRLVAKPTAKVLPPGK